MIVAEMHNVSKSFGRKPILNHTELILRKGEIVGLLGPNGSGKTTLMKILSGLISCDTGSVNTNVRFRSLIEIPCFYNNMSGRSNLEYFAALEGCGEGKVDEIIENLGLSDYIDRKVGKYSLGMRQKLGIACAMLGNPQLLILDEPINGLDPLVIMQIRELMLKLRDQYGITILISSHILNEMQELCDRVVLLQEGRIVGCTDVNKAKRGMKITFFDLEDTRRAMVLLGKYAEKISDTEVIVSNEFPINLAIKKLAMSDINILEVQKAQTNLEALYCKMFRSNRLC